MGIRGYLRVPTKTHLVGACAGTDSDYRVHLAGTGSYYLYLPALVDIPREDGEMIEKKIKLRER